MITRPSPTRLLVLVALLLVASVHPGGAQGTATPVELQETDVFGMGARSLGMGGAASAVSEDVSALLGNPAGLAQIRRVEVSGGLAWRNRDRTVSHVMESSFDFGSTRLDHLAMAYPLPTYRGSLVLAFGFRRLADLDDAYFKEGYLVPLRETDPGVFEGLYELEDYRREGAINAWTVGGAIDLSPTLSIGATLSYLSGSSTEHLTLANYRALQTDNGVVLDVVNPENPPGFDTALHTAYYEMETVRDAGLDGYTGSLGILARFDGGWRVGASLDFPEVLKYEGTGTTRLEDFQKIDRASILFKDDITLPLSLRGGISWGWQGLLLAGDARWTDYTNIDFEGDILAPPSGSSLQRKPAYRSVVAVHLGGEYQLPGAPFRVRGGFFTQPLPYDLTAADTDFRFVPDDGDPNTVTDASVVGRDYPQADIVSDRRYLTAGAGFLIQEALALDVAFAHGWWERATPAGYENGTAFYPTTPTREKTSEDRVVVTTSLHFQ